MNLRDGVNLVRSLGRRLPAGELALPELTRELDATPRILDAGRLAAFRRVTGYPDDGCLPLTYPQVVAFPAQVALLADPRCPLPIAGMVHLTMHVRQRRPIGAGERLRIATRLTPGRTTARGFELELLTTVDAAGETLWEGRAGMLVRRQKAKGERLKNAAKRVAPRLETPPPRAPVTAKTWRVTPEMIRAYARVSRDVNPIHLTAATARLFGMPKAVAHGMWSISRLLSLAADRLGAPNLSLTCAFKLPLFLPSTVTARAWTEGPGLELRLLNDDGTKPHVVATLTTE